MAEETQLLEPGRRAPRKRKLGKRQGHKKSNKKTKVMPALQGHKKVKIDKKMRKLFSKRAQEYNSDDDDDDHDSSVPPITGTGSVASVTNNNNEEEDIESEGEEAGGQDAWNTNDSDMNNGDSEDEVEDADIQSGITKFTEGCRAFRMAFRNIMKKSISEDSLGPVLSANKKLVVDKLAEEEAEHLVKGEAKKEKQMLAEKGHVKPATYLDSHEKFLMSVATKGVVKLFNAVNKAQSAQKGLDPSRGKDAKEIRKRTKEAFFSELGKPSVPATGTSAKAYASTGKGEVEEPAWAPLQNNYMLTSSRLMDWDKMLDKNESDDIGKMSEDSNSDED